MTGIFGNLNNLQKGFVIMGIGIVSIFIVLLLFYISIILLVRLLPEKEKAE